MTSHSPTPWEVAADPGCGGCDWKEKYMVGRRTQTGDVVGVAVVICNDREEANAKLIAAAPDLLAVCKRLVLAQSEDAGAVIEAMDMARAAIAKAEAGNPK